jgi:hypothetical protein
MSRTLKLIIAAAAVALIIAAFFVTREIVRRQEERRLTSYKDTTPVITVTDYDHEKIEKIILKRPEGSYTFEKKDDSWILEGFDHEIDQNEVNSIARSIARMQAERVIEEDPEDLASYGLSDPEVKATGIFADGTEVTVFLGNRTPTGRTYYVKRQEGDTVFSVSGYHGSNFNVETTDLRDRDIKSPVDLDKLIYLKISADETVEVVPIEEDDPKIGLGFSRLKVIQPFLAPRGIDTQYFLELVKKFPNYFRIQEFIDDDPEDLSQYGLEDPRAELEIKDSDGNEFHLLIGDMKDENTIFVKTADRPGVFTINSYELDFLDVKPFSFVERNSLLVNIKFVDGITARTPTWEFNANIEREGEGEDAEETFYVNGEVFPDKPFRKIYQHLIGIALEGLAPEPVTYGESFLTINYKLNIEDEENVKVEFIPYNQDFYAFYHEGVGEFLVSKLQVQEHVEAIQQIIRENTE